MIVTTRYRVYIPKENRCEDFYTQLTEREFIKSLDSTYDEYSIIEIEYGYSC